MDVVKDIPQAVYTGTLNIGDMSFPCSVLSDGTRILTQTDFMRGMGMYYSGWVSRIAPAEMSLQMCRSSSHSRALSPT